MKNIKIILSIILVLCLSLITSTSYAQDSQKKQELGLMFQNMDNFGLIYRFGDENSLWRISSIFGVTYNVNRDFTYPGDLNREKRELKYRKFELRFGKEFRVPINDHLKFRYGIDIFGAYSSDETDLDRSPGPSDYYSKHRDFQTGVGFIIGFNLQINEKLAFGAEIMPRIRYYNNKDVIQDQTFKYSGIDMRISNSPAYLSLVYQF